MYKDITVVSTLYENSIAKVKVGNEVSSWFWIEFEAEQGCVLSPFVWMILIDLILKKTPKALGEHRV